MQGGFEGGPPTAREPPRRANTQEESKGLTENKGLGVSRGKNDPRIPPLCSQQAQTCPPTAQAAVGGDHRTPSAATSSAKGGPACGDHSAVPLPSPARTAAPPQTNGSFCRLFAVGFLASWILSAAKLHPLSKTRSPFAGGAHFNFGFGWCIVSSSCFSFQQK